MIGRWNMMYVANTGIQFEEKHMIGNKPVMYLNISWSLHTFLIRFAKKNTNLNLSLPNGQKSIYISAKDCNTIWKAMNTVGEKGILDELREMYQDIDEYRELQGDVCASSLIFQECNGLSISKYYNIDRGQPTHRTYGILVAEETAIDYPRPSIQELHIAEHTRQIRERMSHDHD